MMHLCPYIILNLTASPMEWVKKRDNYLFLCALIFYFIENIGIQLEWVATNFEWRDDRAKNLFKSFNWNYFTGIYICHHRYLRIQIELISFQYIHVVGSGYYVKEQRMQRKEMPMLLMSSLFYGLISVLCFVLNHTHI